MNRMYTMIPAFEFRRRARAVMKPVLSMLLVLALIAMLPSLINNTVTILTKADPMLLFTDLTEKMNKVILDSGLEGEALNAALEELQLAFLADFNAFLAEKGWLIAALAVLVAVLGPALMLPLLHALLLSLRKKEFTLPGALTHCRYSHKAVGVSVLSMLMILLWMLPGYALMLGGMFVPRIGGLMMLAGLVVAVVLGVRASYHYALASYVLADRPEMKILACIRCSREIMAHRKMELFTLELSFIGWSLLQNLLQTLAASLFGSVIGMTVGMLCNLVLQVYMIASRCAFYCAYLPKEEAAHDAPQQEAAEAEELV